MHTKRKHLHLQMSQPLTGAQPAVACCAFDDGPREELRGFSFGYFYFYFWFKSVSPSSARGQMTPV
jgi:hypothetical protein